MRFSSNRQTLFLLGTIIFLGDAYPSHADPIPLFGQPAACCAPTHVGLPQIFHRPPRPGYRHCWTCDLDEYYGYHPQSWSVMNTPPAFAQVPVVPKSVSPNPMTKDDEAKEDEEMAPPPKTKPKKDDAKEDEMGDDGPPKSKPKKDDAPEDDPLPPKRKPKTDKPKADPSDEEMPLPPKDKGKLEKLKKDPIPDMP